jgi:hypothetical protein
LCPQDSWLRIGAPGLAYKLSNLRGRVICAQAQLKALETEDVDAADAVFRVLRAVKNQLEDLVYELQTGVQS